MNSPVQVFSIDSSDTLTLDHITIDNSAGDTEGAHNTGAFDVGDSNGITISNAIVYNQDDCLAVNSGTVSFRLLLKKIVLIIIEYYLYWRYLLRWPWLI